MLTEMQYSGRSPFKFSASDYYLSGNGVGKLNKVLIRQFELITPDIDHVKLGLEGTFSQLVYGGTYFA